ncbi:MAG TPA: tetratricopeptide repeat protein [Bosea sp. (in: a-proteobacteria)]|uniref:tetratricopeptide repeat protein n=1 Tax=Bosea sp. (in: a-proteobacteria) TaxID=1871050 RepID=UPI002E13CFD6|nr:tetratricopeptide repeat protein [Bosea sp. (in: a-proteobacteria)]
MAAIVAPVDEAAAWVRTALAYIEAHPGTEHWRGPLYNNLGWSYFEANRFEEALAAFRQGVLIREASGQPRELRIARYTVIRSLRALARYEEAIALGEMVITLADASGEAAPFVYEELAECHAATRDEAMAKAYAKRAVAAFEHDIQFRSNEPARFARLLDLASSFSPATQ